MNNSNMISVFLFITLISHLPQNMASTPEKHHGHGHGHGHHHKSVLDKACQQTHNKDVCLSALDADPNSHSADLKGLALIALRLASSNASDVSEHIKVLLNNDTTLSPAAQDGASECLENYLDASEQLDDSIAALLADAHNDVETWVGVALTDADSCDAALGENKGVVLGDKGEAFRRLCDYAVVFSKLAEDQKRKN